MGESDPLPRTSPRLQQEQRHGGGGGNGEMHPLKISQKGKNFKNMGYFYAFNIIKISFSVITKNMCSGRASITMGAGPPPGGIAPSTPEVPSPPPNNLPWHPGVHSQDRLGGVRDPQKVDLLDLKSGLF